MSEVNHNSGWHIPDNYYEEIATNGPNSFIHWAGRALIAPYRYAMHGSPVIDTTAGFDLMRSNGEFEPGNIIIPATHRSGKETVFQPAVFEAVGLHHARPLSKKEKNMDHPAMRWGMHQLGVFAVDKKSPNVQGVAEAQRRILLGGGIITVYVEGTRIYTNIDRVAILQKGAIFTAVENDSLIIPHAVAGMSTVKVGESPNRRVVARDQLAPFGRNPKNILKKGLPVVHAFGTPFRFDKPGFKLSIDRAAGREVVGQTREYMNECAVILRNKLQIVINRAYEVRGSMLETNLEE